MLQMYDNIAVLQMCENNFLNYLHCTTNVLPLHSWSSNTK
jgi:hypothetical protein